MLSTNNRLSGKFMEDYIKVSSSSKTQRIQILKILAVVCNGLCIQTFSVLGSNEAFEYIENDCFANTF